MVDWIFIFFKETTPWKAKVMRAWQPHWWADDHRMMSRRRRGGRGETSVGQREDFFKAKTHVAQQKTGWSKQSLMSQLSLLLWPEHQERLNPLGRNQPQIGAGDVKHLRETVLSRRWNGMVAHITETPNTIRRNNSRKAVGRLVRSNACLKN